MEMRERQSRINMTQSKRQPETAERSYFNRTWFLFIFTSWNNILLSSINISEVIVSVSQFYEKRSFL